MASLIIVTATRFCLAAAPSTQETGGEIGVVAYVANASVHLGDEFPIILEITNHSQSTLKISNHPELSKKNGSGVKHITAQKIPSDLHSVNLSPKVSLIYPRGVELSGYAITGRIDLRTATCGPGETALVKIIVRREIFQPGKCNLAISLNAHNGGDDLNVAESEELELTVFRKTRDQ